MSWRLITGEDGPEWRGQDKILNPLHGLRWHAFRFAAGLIGSHLLLAWVIESLTAIGLSRDTAANWTSLCWLVLLLPGLGALVFGGWFCRKYITRDWRLWVSQHGRAFNYRGRVGLYATLLDMAGLAYAAEMMGLGPDTDAWIVAIAHVARVEAGASAEWEPTRRTMFWEKPVPREEVQAFLFMGDGSRRVISTVHGGRESVSTLAHSIRSWLDHQRQGERLVSTTRKPVAAPELVDGFSI